MVSKTLGKKVKKGFDILELTEIEIVVVKAFLNWVSVLNYKCNLWVYDHFLFYVYEFSSWNSLYIKIDFIWQKATNVVAVSIFIDF